jgi:MtN3 and saliva related transmembrane protein
MDKFLFQEALGLLAGLFSTLAFLPQVILVWRTRSTDDVSLSSFVLLGAACLLWTVYGAMLGSLSIVATNIVVFSLVLAIVVAKLRFSRR